MPKLITQRRTRRKAPPCGRIVETFEPHSPFQLLIDGRRSQLGLSTRELARNMDEIAPTRQSTLWMWLHNKNGYPSPRSLKPKHITAFSKVLKLSAQEIKDAIDASRPMFRPGQIPTPAPSLDAIQSLIDILGNDKRKWVPRGYVINLAKNLHNGLLHAQKDTRR